MKITNTQSGPRGINAVIGAVMIAPGETVELDVYKREQQHIEAAGWFEVEGEYTPDPSASSSGQNVLSAPADAGRDGVYIPASEFNAMRETFERLQAENEQLRNQASANAAGQDTGTPGADGQDVPLDRDALKAEAEKLEIDYPKNISTEKLKELIDAKKAG